MARLLVVAVLTAIIIITCAGIAVSQQNPIPSNVQGFDIDKRFNVEIGFQVTDFGSSVRLDTDGTTGTDIDVEGDLGIDSNVTLLQANFLWRVGKRDFLSIGYLDINRSGGRILDRTIVFGDQTFDIDTAVDAYLDTLFIPVTYWHSFQRTDNTELGWSFGLSGTTITTGISTSTQVNGNVTRRSESASLWAPVPLLGVYGSWRYAPKLRLAGFIQYFTLNLDDVEGSQIYYTIGTDWNLAKDSLLGIAYSFNKISIDEADISDFEGSLDYKFDGLLLYGSYFF